VSNTPRSVIAVDPGDEHVGIAGWMWMGQPPVQAAEVQARDAPVLIDDVLRSAERNGVVTVLVIEEFVLYPWAASAQSWSPMHTAEMIGQLKWIAESHGSSWVLQGANIKKPMAAQLRGRGVERVGKGTHASDAELHLYHYLFREGLIKEGLWRT
jgi:hypothetical protein